MLTLGVVTGTLIVGLVTVISCGIVKSGTVRSGIVRSGIVRFEIIIGYSKAAALPGARTTMISITRLTSRETTPLFLYIYSSPQNLR